MKALVVEEAHVGESHGDVVFVAGHDDMVVAHGAAGLGDVLHAALVGALDVVAKGEEGVAAEAYAAVLGYPQALLLVGEGFGLVLEELLPGALAEHVVALVADVDVDGVVAVGTADAVDEGEVHHLGVLPQPPRVGFVACQAGAMDAALLAGSDADGLPVLDVADGVGLGVFQRDEGDGQVAAGFSGEGLVARGDVGEEGGVVEAYLVAALLEGDAEHLLALDGCRAIDGVDADDVVGAFPLLAQDLEGLFREVGCDHAVADLTFQDGGGHGIAGVGEGHEVAVGAHAVGSAGTDIGAGDGRQLLLDVVDEIDFPECVAQGESHGGASGRHVLERGGGGQAGGLFQLAHQLPAVEGVEQVDVAGSAVQDFDG